MKVSPTVTNVLLWFNMLTAVYGGGYLLGGAAGMDRAWLDSSPFDSYAIPGAILLVVVAGSSLIAVIMRLRGHAQANTMTLVAGAILLGWLIVEFFWVPQAWPAQIFYAIVALGILIGGWQERQASE